MKDLEAIGQILMAVGLLFFVTVALDATLLDGKMLTHTKQSTQYQIGKLK
jgi:hypothetical protein